ncbi:MAG: DUF3138 family protein, partial [Oligoflexia bacterium]|nr:DUF3138 family protein [Oligoflexia bacterium]
LNKIKWGGALDVQYNYNLGMPAPTAAPAAGTNAAPSGLNRYVQPGSHHDQFTLALAMVSAEKQAEPFGFKIDVGFGKAAEATAGTNNDASSRNVLQAYANYASEFGLEISMGKFFAPLGRESLYTPHNLNTSYSYIFSYLTPTWLVGAKATQKIGDIVAITGFVGNGSNVTYDNNKNKTFGGVVDFIPGFGIKAKAGFSGGNERADATGKDERSIMSGTLEYDLLEWGLLTMAADFAEASEAISDQPSQKARSTAVYGWLKAPFGFSIGARHEMYYDGVISFGALPGGYSDTAAINQGGLNINATSALLRFDDDGFSLRAEYRTDAANHPVFTKEDGATNNQNVVTVSSTFSF